MIRARAAAALTPALVARRAVASRQGRATSNQLLQAKLKIGPVDDPFEREADRVADAVVQRKCATCAREEEDETVRLKVAGPARGSADAAVAGLGGGTPLPRGERRFFEARLGRDLSAVRVHAEATGASTIGARAFTLGNRVAFAPGEWQPGTTQGRKLLAHELVHVIQQGAGGGPALRRQPAAASGAPEIEEQPPPNLETAPADAGATDSTTEGKAGVQAPAPKPPPPAPAPVTAGGHAAAPAGMAACPDAPQREIIIVGCKTSAAAVPPAVEKAQLPTLDPARFGGNATRATFARELAQCHAARTVNGEIEKRYKLGVAAARKQATEQAKLDTEAAVEAAGKSASARATARNEAKKAAAKKIADAEGAVKREAVAVVTAELATRLEDGLASDFGDTMRGALARYGPGWLAKMQKALTSKRAKLTKEKNAKPKLARGETPPPPRPAAEIAREIEAEMVEIRCSEEEWARNQIEGMARAWAVGRREEVDFLTIPQKAKFLANFVPSYVPPASSLVDIPGTTGMAKVAPEFAAFLAQLQTDVKADPAVPSFRAENYAGHGGGKASEPRHFAGKGFSADIYIEAPNDQRGFWQPRAAVAFLVQLDATAKAFGARWRVLYNDFRVAQAINEASGAMNVAFMGQSGGGQSNWHGPAPLVLHFHLDLEIPQAPAAPAGGTPSQPTAPAGGTP